MNSRLTGAAVNGGDAAAAEDRNFAAMVTVIVKVNICCTTKKSRRRLAFTEAFKSSFIGSGHSPSRDISGRRPNQ
jgi:hypothetical protein